MAEHRDESDFCDEDKGDDANVHIDDIEVSNIMNKSRLQLSALAKVSGVNKLEHLQKSDERAFKWPVTQGFMEQGSGSKKSYFDKSESNFLSKLSQKDGSKFMARQTKSFLTPAVAVKTDLIEEHTDEHFYEDHADEEITDLLHQHDDGDHCLADHFAEVGEPDKECHFDEENDIEYIVHELMDWGFTYKEMDEVFDSTEDLRAAIDFIDKEHEWQIDHEGDYEDDGEKEEEEEMDPFYQDELLAFKLQVDEIRPIVLPDGVKSLPMQPKVRMLRDKKTKRWYYVDDFTKKTTWIMPKVPTHAEIDKMNGATLTKELKRYDHVQKGRFNRELAIRALKTRRDQYVKDTQLGKVKHIRLPPDWRTMVEPKTGRLYFANSKLNTTQWETPKFEPTLPRGWVKIKVRGKIVYFNAERNQTVNTLEGIYAISLHRQVRSRDQAARVKQQKYRHAHRASLKKLIEDAKKERLEDERKRKIKRKVTRETRQKRSKAIHKILRECCEIEKAERLRKERARKKEREQNRDARDIKRAKELEVMRDEMDILKEARLDNEENRKINREVQRASYMQGRQSALGNQRTEVDEKYEARLEEARRRKEEEIMKREEDRIRREEAAEKQRELRRQQQEEEERRQKERAAERAAEEERARKKQEEEEREKKRMEEERQRQQKRRDLHNKASRLIKSKQTGVNISDFNRVYSKAYNELWDDIIAGQMKILVQNTPPFSTQYVACGSGNHARIIWADTWKQFKAYKEADAVKALEECQTLQQAHQKLRSSGQPAAQPRRSVASNPRNSSLNAGAAGPLPMGWSARKDPRTGRTYYLNNITKTTTWKRPQAPQRGFNNGLPPGWVAKRDPVQGKIYFQNNQTKRTQWNDPRPLPAGWIAKRDQRTGKTYYANHITKTTSWKDPRPPIRI